MSLHTPASPTTVTDVPTLIYASHNGTSQLPQLILVQNASITTNIAVGGANVDYDGAPKVVPAANFEVRLEGGASLYAICDTGETADVCWIVTRYNLT